MKSFLSVPLFFLSPLEKRSRKISVAPGGRLAKHRGTKEGYSTTSDGRGQNMVAAEHGAHGYPGASSNENFRT